MKIKENKEKEKKERKKSKGKSTEIVYFFKISIVHLLERDKPTFFLLEVYINDHGNFKSCIQVTVAQAQINKYTIWQEPLSSASKNARNALLTRWT